MRSSIWAFAALVSVAAVSCSSRKSVDPTDLGIAGPYGKFQGQEAKGEKNFATLINNYAKARPDRTPWVGSFWPYTANGIARPGAGGSPAGKYDAVLGGRSVSRAQDWEVTHHGSGVPNVQGWWGHCNGWCVAAALYPEPRSPVTVNGVTFGVADIKGLMSEVGMSASADYFGERADPWDPDYAREIEDVAANQYFLVLTNYMGKEHKVILIDRYTTDQIWNQPLAGYEFDYPKPGDYLGESPDAPGVYRINLTSRIWWASDFVSADDLTPEFNFPEGDTAYFQSRVLRQEVWLDGPVVFDSSGKIVSSGNVTVARDGRFFVGGEWKNGPITSESHPDYMWVPYSFVKPDPNDRDPPANIYVDYEWITKYLVNGEPYAGGPAAPVDPAPNPSRAPSPRPSRSPRPSVVPQPIPTTLPSMIPVPRPSSWPLPRPSRTPIPLPSWTWAPPSPRPTPHLVGSPALEPPSESDPS